MSEKSTPRRPVTMSPRTQSNDKFMDAKGSQSAPPKISKFKQSNPKKGKQEVKPPAPLNFYDPKRIPGYDCVLQVAHNKQLYCHKAMLASWSPLLDETFEENGHQKDEEPFEIDLRHKRPEDPVELLRVIYPPNSSIAGKQSYFFEIELQEIPKVYTSSISDSINLISIYKP